MTETQLESGKVRVRGSAARADAAEGYSLLGRRGFWRDALLRRMLAAADLAAAFLVAIVLGLIAADGFDTALWSLVLAPVWLLAAKMHGLYDRDQRVLRHLTIDELPSLAIWGVTGAGALALLLVFAPVGAPTLATALEAWAVAVPAAAAGRSLARWLWRRVTPPERTLIVGDGRLARETRRKLELFADIHVDVVREQPRLTADDDLHGVDRILVASDALDGSLVPGLVDACRRANVKLSVIPPVRGMFGSAVELNHVADLPLVEYNTWDVSRSTLLLKRTLDLAVAAVALVLVAPLMAAIALAVRLDSRGPVFFRQVRASAGGRPFLMLKFRTMVENAEELLGDLVALDELPEPVFKLPDDPRATRIGRLLRRTSLDELPQLLNVVRGDMSLVGPRPEQIELVARYEPEHRFRLTVRPGLTGPMQVFGRGHLTLDERLALERDYIENLSLRRDLRILALTVSAIATGRGAY